MAIKLGADGQLKAVGKKKEYSRTSDQLSEEAYPKLQKNKDKSPAGIAYFRSLLSSLEGMLNKLGKSTNAGTNIEEISFVDIYKKIFIYLDNQDDALFSVLTEEEHAIFFNATARVATFQNAASELKEMTSEQMEELKILQEKQKRIQQLVGNDLGSLELPDIGIG